MNQVSSNPRAAQPVIGSLDTPHTEFLGLPFCLLSQREAVRLIIARRGAPYRYVVTPNAYHVVKAHDEPTRLLPAYRAAWLSFLRQSDFARAGVARRALAASRCWK